MESGRDVPALFPARVTNYELIALRSAPAVVGLMLEGLSTSEADFRPDPERFTIREAVAHLADWEEIFLSRIVKSLEEDRPVLQGFDEWQIAQERKYSERDWNEQLSLFSKRRAELVGLLESLGPDEWLRFGHHSELGPITVQVHAALIVAHDGYHKEQIAEWRRAYAAR